MQKTVSQARVYLISLFAVLLTGCSYHRPSAVLTPPHEGHEQKQENVSVRVKPLRDFECSHYFDNRLVSRGIQPIQLYIQNESEQYYVLDGSEISLPIMGKRDIGAVLYKNVVPRSFVWLFSTIAFSWKIFLPVFVIDMLFCAQANKNIKSDVTSICINPKEKVVLAPHSRTHKVLFVGVDEYHHHLSVTLHEQQSDKALLFKF